MTLEKIIGGSINPNIWCFEHKNKIDKALATLAREERESKRKRERETERDNQY